MCPSSCSTTVSKDLTAQEQRHRIYYRLARDLRSDRFQAYVLEDALTGLVQDASTQLARLTGERYGLAFVGDRIVAVDHDNAGKLRAIDTLRGGETPAPKLEPLAAWIAAGR